MKRAILSYVINDRESPDRINDGLGVNIDESIALALKTRDARDAVRSTYQGRVEFVVRLYESVGNIAVFLKELEEASLEFALRDYINIAGLPTSIGNGSDWNICDRVLAEYGKTTRRHFVGCAAGKWVEDL